MISLYNKLIDLIKHLNYKEFYIDENLFICIENKLVCLFPEDLHNYCWYGNIITFYKINNDKFDHMNITNCYCFIIDSMDDDDEPGTNTDIIYIC